MVNSIYSEEISPDDPSAYQGDGGYPPYQQDYDDDEYGESSESDGSSFAGKDKKPRRPQCVCFKRTLLTITIFAILGFIGIMVVLPMLSNKAEIETSAALIDPGRSCVNEIQDVHDTELSLLIAGRGTPLNVEEAQAMEDLVLVAYNTATSQCSDIYKRWMTESWLWDQDVLTDSNGERALSVHFLLSISCDGCPASETLASYFPDGIDARRVLGSGISNVGVTSDQMRRLPGPSEGGPEAPKGPDGASPGPQTGPDGATPGVANEAPEPPKGPEGATPGVTNEGTGPTEVSSGVEGPDGATPGVANEAPEPPKGPEGATPGVTNEETGPTEVSSGVATGETEVQNMAVEVKLENEEPDFETDYPEATEDPEPTEGLEAPEVPEATEVSDPAAGVPDIPDAFADLTSATVYADEFLFGIEQGLPEDDLGLIAVRIFTQADGSLIELKLLPCSSATGDFNFGGIDGPFAGAVGFPTADICKRRP